VVSVGVFDGMHLGHEAIIRANLACARELGAVPTVVTFSEHPKKMLLGKAPRTLTSLEHRLELFRRAGIGHAVALTFDEELRETPARTFVDELLLKGLGARKLVLGFDSKFGRNREGTPEFVRELGCDVEVVPRVRVGRRAVSSTAIREAVELGDLVGAARMLGRPVAVYGDVIEGDRLGRELGFPTANLDLHHELHPPPGVYVCLVRRQWEDEPRRGVANIGLRPTVVPDPAGAQAEPRVEVHLLDFEGDLYGEFLEVEFVARLRDEQRFPGLDALRAQIGKDVLQARKLLEESEQGPSHPAGDGSGPGSTSELG